MGLETKHVTNLLTGKRPWGAADPAYGPNVQKPVACNRRVSFDTPVALKVDHCQAPPALVDFRPRV